MHPDPIFVPSPITTAPICGIIDVLDLSGIKPKPSFPITEFGAIITSSPIIANSIKTPEEINELFPILLLLETFTLSAINVLSSITTPSSIIVYAPIETLLPIDTEL